MPLRVQPYDCKTEYKPGPAMTIADYLSRVTLKTVRGNPDQLIIDTGRQFVSEELDNFTKEWEISRQARFIPSPMNSLSAWCKPSRRHSRNAAIQNQILS
ncbi:hypothetical protein PoB_006078400 [Plakobranchus ocellatus]|uniref:Integrase catalytic domain-containing protein n=1 Tax=Plakobranchus ocellatus TaxID=259542 RepID=A0AAV4CQU8_9GAST|nr:hypothetical protein PoB_006078400 [Plakobranchus ocellatus]